MAQPLSLAEQLQQHGDFLNLTLANPDGLAPLQFSLADKTNVSIWDSGVICFEPTAGGSKDIVLSCGVHGNETAPIEICAALVQQLLTGKLKLKHRLLVLFGNPAAINAGSREISENLNRLFSGHHSMGAGLINAERKRAKALEDYVSRFYNEVRVTDSVPRNRYLYDLHTAIRGSRFEKFAVFPFLHDIPWQKAVFEFKPTIWIGVASQVVQGQVMNSAIISNINTELSLLGIASADIVMTGGGPGANSTPFAFNLENIVMC